MIYTLTLNPAVDFQYVVSDIEFNQVLRASETNLDMGGKGFNVSRMLAELQASSTALGIVAGKQGKFLSDGLHSLGIVTKLIEIPGETRMNVSVVVDDQDRYIKVNGPGPTVSSDSLAQLLEQIATLAAPGDWWVLSGSVPPGVDAGIYAEIIAILRKAGASTVLDTSGEPLMLGLKAGPTVVKPNAEETIELTKSSLAGVAEIAAGASRIRELGAETVVVSLGKEGALLHDGSKVWFAPAPKIEEKNPVGAGDSLVAGLVFKLSQQAPLRDALVWGIACGSATASRSGTAMGERKQIAELAATIEVKEVTHAV